LDKSITLQGYIQSTDQKLSDFFSDYFPRKDDFLKNEITLKHLLTMSSGFTWEGDGNNDEIYSPDPVDSILNYTLETTPGSKFIYNKELNDVDDRYFFVIITTCLKAAGL
jgi:CubicO group peptidase (beta-lactamase class C family)